MPIADSVADSVDEPHRITEPVALTQRFARAISRTQPLAGAKPVALTQRFARAIAVHIADAVHVTDPVSVGPAVGIPGAIRPAVRVDQPVALA